MMLSVSHDDVRARLLVTLEGFERGEALPSSFHPVFENAFGVSKGTKLWIGRGSLDAKDRKTVIAALRRYVKGAKRADLNFLGLHMGLAR